MAFFKFRARGPQRNEGRTTSPAAPAESIEAMRRRARHRLLGAAVLVFLGVVGFPLLFDSQPRPVPVDIPIEIPDRTKVKPLEIPATPEPASAPKSAAPDASTETTRASAAGRMITEAADGTEITSDKPSSPAAAPVLAAPVPQPEAEAKTKPESKADLNTPEVKHESKPEVKYDVKPEAKDKAEPKPEPKTAATGSSANDGARARALLDGKFPAAKATAPAAPIAPADAAGRFVVQVGAFADPAKAREMRQKLENAGLKTYTVVAKTPDGDRTRVRVGPFATRADADRAAGRIKGLSLPAAVLSL